MRIFIGIQLPPYLQRKVLQWHEKYQKTFYPFGIRWITPENLHITILPPWYVEDVSEIVAFLKQKIHGSRFAIYFESIRFMPQERPKFVWTFGQPPEALLALRQNISQALSRPLEKRKYMLHTTIGRMQKDATFTPFTEDIHWAIHIEKFTLFQSHFSSQGAEYTSIHEFSLK